jgi:hypothetical protein
LTALKKLAKGAESDELTAAFEKHRDETEGQIGRLEQVFEILGKRAQGKTCPAIDGIIEEGQEILEEFEDAPALDAGLGGGGAGSRALRDRPLRYPCDMGGLARFEERRSLARSKPSRKKRQPTKRCRYSARPG